MGASCVGVSLPRSIEAVLERDAVEVLHDDVAVAVGQVAEIEDVADVQRADACDGARLTLEAGDEIGHRRDLRVQHLDGDAPRDASVLALVDGAHAPLSDETDHLVLGVDDLSGLECHAAARY